jgi:hypothetical protein
MRGKGNYWLELISKEKDFRKEIAAAVEQVIGKSFMDYEELHDHVMNNIRTRLEYYGLKNNLGDFKLDYNVDLHYDVDFYLEGYTIRYVYVMEEFF